MTTEAMQHRFDAAIIGKEVRGQRVMLKLDWKLPGSKYEFTLYVEPDDAQALNVGDRLSWSITRGGLKDGKEGKYSTDFFWDWNKDGSATARVSPTVATEPMAISEDRFDEPEDDSQDGYSHALFDNFPENPPNKNDAGFPGGYIDPRNGPTGSETPNAGPPPNPAAVGACQKDAMVYIESGEWVRPEGRTVESWHRECRDFLYWNLNQVPVMPHHWCYVHSTERTKSSRGSWFHKHADNFCMESGVFDSDGNQVEEENDNT